MRLLQFNVVATGCNNFIRKKNSFHEWRLLRYMHIAIQQMLYLPKLPPSGCMSFDCVLNCNPYILFLDVGYLWLWLMSIFCGIEIYMCSPNTIQRRQNFSKIIMYILIWSIFKFSLVVLAGVESALCPKSTKHTNNII